MVARGGIEPPTRGFSVLANVHPAAPTVTYNNYSGQVALPVDDGRCSWVTLGWKPRWKPASVRSRPAEVNPGGISIFSIRDLLTSAVRGAIARTLTSHAIAAPQAALDELSAASIRVACMRLPVS